MRCYERDSGAVWIIRHTLVNEACQKTEDRESVCQTSCEELKRSASRKSNLLLKTGLMKNSGRN